MSTSREISAQQGTPAEILEAYFRGDDDAVPARLRGVTEGQAIDASQSLIARLAEAERLLRQHIAGHAEYRNEVRRFLDAGVAP